MQGIEYTFYKRLKLDIYNVDRAEAKRRLQDAADKFSKDLKAKFPQIEIIKVLWISQCAIKVLIPEEEISTLPEQITKAFGCKIIKPGRLEQD